MKTSNILFTFFIGLTMSLTCSCQGYTDNAIQQTPSIENPVSTAKKYVENNSYIDVDVDKLNNQLVSQQTRSVNVDSDDIAKMKAAMYRFYSHVRLVNDLYSCDISSAADINVSDRLYNVLLSNLNDMNSYIQQMKESGQEVIMPEVDNTYLNSLLK